MGAPWDGNERHHLHWPRFATWFGKHHSVLPDAAAMHEVFRTFENVSLLVSGVMFYAPYVER